MNKFSSLLLSSFLFCSLYLQAQENLDCGSVDGVELPCWREFLGHNEADESLPYYPYVKRPNGCSLYFFPPGSYDAFKTKNQHYSFKNACMSHDRCYYQLDSKARICNENFRLDLKSECLKAPSILEFNYCQKRAEVFYRAVVLFSRISHDYAQELTRAYLQKVDEYLKYHRAPNSPLP